MLPAAHRMRRSSDFEVAVRRGRRAGRRTVVVHANLNHDPGSAQEAARVGFVVSKAVGTAVVRNRVKRRLRAVLASRLSSLPAGALIVVRANPAAATVTSAVLSSEVDAALGRVLAGSAGPAPAGRVPGAGAPGRNVAGSIT